MADDFQRIIQEDRETRKKTMWKGTMMEYLEIARENPDLACLAHKRLYNMIVGQGVNEIDPSEDPRLKRLYKGEKIKIVNFFADDFYGMDKTVNQIVRYFHSASLKGAALRH